MNLTRTIALLCAAIVTGGCTVKNIDVRYYSDPPGAILYDGERKLGFAPYSLRYNVSKEQLATGKMLLDGYGPRVVARWKSGAQSEVPDGMYFDISKATIFKSDGYYYVL